MSSTRATLPRFRAPGVSPECDVRRASAVLTTALLVTLLVLLIVVAAACSSSGSSDSSSSGGGTGAGKPTADEPWPAPPTRWPGRAAAGLVPETAERLQYHVHSHLDVFINGTHIIVPGGLGINTKDPGVHSGTIDGQPAYGGITVPCDNPCISPLHTHDATGILHTESATPVGNTLGQLFTEWGVTLNATAWARTAGPTTTSRSTSGGKKFTGDPRSIPLRNLEEIAIVIGKPPAKIPSIGDFSGL